MAGVGASGLAANIHAQEQGTDVLSMSMRKAAGCCLAWLDPKHDYFPTGGYEVAHDTGRWWDAMLRWEAATGNAIPEQLEAAMLRNIQALTSNPAALLMNTEATGTPASKLRVNTHNIRESMLAYVALMQHRRSDWARERGQVLVRAIDNALDSDGQLDFSRLARPLGAPVTTDPLMVHRSVPNKWFDATAGTGRALEAFLLFSELTGDSAAKRLVERVAEAQFKQTIGADGRVRREFLDREHVGHNHSYCGTLRGLLLYGLKTRRQDYVRGVLNTYRRGLFGTTISESGWTPHDLGKVRFPNEWGDPVGEHASCGDIAQMGMWLGLRDGQEDLLDDVERLVRARLLPSQIDEPENPRRDGAWGVYAHPYGRGSILDVFAAVLHSLADLYTHVVTTARDRTTSINFHFSVDTPAVRIVCSRKERGQLRITSKKRQPLLIRVPGWAPRPSVRLRVQDRPATLRWKGSYLATGVLSPNTAIELEYDLPTRKSVEVMPVSGKRFELSWRGDEVVGCNPEVPIYPAASSRFQTENPTRASTWFRPGQP